MREHFSRARFGDEMAALIAEHGGMVNRHNRLLVALHVLSDALLGVSAFIIAYALRFHTPSPLIPITKGVPPLRQYINVLPFIAVARAARLPAAGPLSAAARPIARRRFLRGLRRQHPRGRLRHRRDAVRADLLRDRRRARRAARSRCRRPVWAIFLVLNVALTFASRELVREVLERRWRAGIGLKRILIAGSGELGRLVADKILEHRELGYQIVGFVDDRGGRRSPRLSRAAAARHDRRSGGDLRARGDRSPVRRAAARAARADARAASRAPAARCVDVKVVPDLLQVIALRARLEDLDGVPVININDVPLQGFNTHRQARRSTSRSRPRALLVLGDSARRSSPLLVRLTSRGPVFYRQERMGLDGKPFTISSSARCTTTPRRTPGRCGRSEDDPRVTPLGRFLRRSNIDELPQLWNVLTRRHVDRRPAAGAAALRRAVQAQDPAVHAAPQGEGRASPAGRRSTAGAATRRSRSGSSTTCTTSRTGRCAST